MTILPGEGAFIPKGFILLKNDRIQAMGPGEGPEGDEVRDARGLVAIPGLVNSHTHLALTAYRGIADDIRLFEFLAETRKRWAAATHSETFDAARAGCLAAVRSGTTCLYDSHATSPRPVAAAAREVGVRILAAGGARSTWFGAPAIDTLPDILRETQAMIKEHVSTDLMVIPSLGAHSPYSCTPQQIRQVKAICRDRGWLFTIHLAECEEEVQLIRNWSQMTPAAYLDSLGVLDDRTVLAHAVFLDAQDIRILADRGSHIAHCPKSNAKLGDGVAPIPACVVAGVSVALGTDSMVSNNNLDMLEEMRFGTLIHRGMHRDPAVMTARQMFTMATIGGARALGLAHEIGSLRAGKKGDLVLLKLHPPLGFTETAVLSELVFHATAEVVRTVIVDGRVVLDRDA